MNLETKQAQANPELDKAAIAKAMASVTAAAAELKADPTRPTYHFLPPAYWMNDPNGTIYHNGWYHLFYQHNPYGDDWGHMHWGHARSRDLVRWEHLLIALWPSLDLGEEHVYSGCARLDADGNPLLFYTSVKSGPRDGREPNEQWAASPLDDEWITWQKDPQNPVLALPTHGGPTFYGEWRDPYIFEANGRSFLVLGAVDDHHAEVALYEATDGSLLRWRYCGPLVTEDRKPGRYPECPNFILAPAAAEPGAKPKWILITSPYSLLEYVTGEFDPTALTFTQEQYGILDPGYGKTPNFYASNTLDDKDGNVILLGWVRGFDPHHGWNGALALPRILTIGADGHPRQQPIPQLAALRGSHQSFDAATILPGVEVLAGVIGDTLELRTTLALGSAQAAGLRLHSSSDGQHGVDIRWDGSELIVAGSPVQLALPAGTELDLHVFLDHSVIEVFAGQGRVSVTRIVYPSTSDLAVAVFAEGGDAHFGKLDVWQINPIW